MLDDDELYHPPEEPAPVVPQSEDAAPAVVPTCPQRHAMLSAKTAKSKTSRWSCDTCQKDVPPSSKTKDAQDARAKEREQEKAQKPPPEEKKEEQPQQAQKPPPEEKKEAQPQQTQEEPRPGEGKDAQEGPSHAAARSGMSLADFEDGGVVMFMAHWRAKHTPARAPAAGAAPAAADAAEGSDCCRNAYSGAQGRAGDATGAIGGSWTAPTRPSAMWNGIAAKRKGGRMNFMQSSKGG
eukprot:gene23254-65439_t